MKIVPICKICCLALFLAVFGFERDGGAQTTTAKQDSKADQEKDSKDETKPFLVKVADENIHFTVTGKWKKAPLRNSVIEYEIKIPRTGTDKQDGRLTIMGAGGGVEANVERWKQQFSQPDDSDTSDKTKTKKQTIAGQTVHWVDIQGTFMDAPGGPFSGQPKVERKNYRMLAAIIETENDGQYFVKFYGPKATVDKNEKHFKAMIESLQVAD